MKTLDLIQGITTKYNKGAKIDDGKYLVLKGNTYEIKESLKEDGFKFDPQTKEWFLELEEPLSFGSDEIRYFEGKVENLEYLSSFDMLFEGKQGLFIGKTNDGFSTIEL